MSDQPKRHGGPRPGSGRPRTDNERRHLFLPPATWAAIANYQRQRGFKSLSAAALELLLLGIATTKQEQER